MSISLAEAGALVGRELPPFHTRAKGIESVALRACREQLTQLVIVEEEQRENGDNDHDTRDRMRIVRLTLRR